MQNHDDLYEQWNGKQSSDDNIDLLLDESEGGISEAEREIILNQIDQVLVRKSGLEGPGEFRYRPERNGALFPVLINMLILIFTAAGVWGLFTIFDRQEASIIQDDTAALTAEGSLLREFREESEKEIAAREEEIGTIRSQLDTLQEEKNELAARNERILQEKESELQGELQRLLQEEREQLDARGIDEAEKNRLLGEMEQRINREHRQELAELEEENLRALQEREAEIEQLAASYEERISISEAERQGAYTELAALQEERSQAELIVQQLSAGYQRVLDRTEAGDYDSARSSLETLESILARDAVRNVPELSRRSATDRALITGLERLISLEEQNTEVAAAASRVPQVDTEAELRLRDTISDQEAEIEQLKTTLEESRQDAENLQRNLEQTRGRLSTANRDLTELRSSRLSASAVAEQRKEQLAELESSARSSSVRSSSSDRREEVLSAVDTKLKIREILASETVRDTYPDAESTFESYLETFQDEYERVGYREALTDLTRILEEVSTGGAGGGDESFSRSGGEVSQAAAELLEELQGLLED
ncbi:MAG: hypothetical protein ACP5IA_13130 [Sediminispirochaetaceae bacterium]